MVVPLWAWYERVCESDQHAPLFSVQDIPLIKMLSSYCEEPYVPHAGDQPAIDTFVFARR